MGLKSCTLVQYYRKGWDHGISVQLKEINIMDRLFCWRMQFITKCLWKTKSTHHLFNESTRQTKWKTLGGYVKSKKYHNLTVVNDVRFCVCE
jgi:hypothetical protein